MSTSEGTAKDNKKAKALNEVNPGNKKQLGKWQYPKALEKTKEKGLPLQAKPGSENGRISKEPDIPGVGAPIAYYSDSDHLYVLMEYNQGGKEKSKKEKANTTIGRAKFTGTEISLGLESLCKRGIISKAGSLGTYLVSFKKTKADELFGF
jgi:hypothetical protein